MKNDETRRLLLLQNAAFLPLYRGNRGDKGIHIDTLEPLMPNAQGDEAVAEIFADIGNDRLMAARKMLGYLKDHPSPKPFADAARFVFMNELLGRLREDRFVAGGNEHRRASCRLTNQKLATVRPETRNQLGTVGDFESPKHLPNVDLHRALRARELFRDVSVRLPPSQALQDQELSGRKGPTCTSHLHPSVVRP